MKRKYIFIPILASAVALTSCKDKATTTTSSEDSTAPADKGQNASPTTEPDSIAKSVSIEDRASKLGFARHLPKNVVAYNAFFNGRKAFEDLLQTPLGEFAMQRMADEGVTLEDLAENEEVTSQLAMYSEEYFTAYGKGSSETFSLMIKLYERILYYGGRTGMFAADAELAEGSFNPESPAVLLEGPLNGGIKELLAIFAEAQVPAIYQGAKISNSDERQAVAVQMEQGISFLQFIGDELVEEITIKRGENEFSGYKITGAKLVEIMGDDMLSEIGEFVDAADITAFKKSLGEKNLVAVSGTVGDYVVLFLGQSEDDFVLVDKVEDSVCANENLGYVDPYIEKDIMLAGFRDASVMEDLKSVSSVAFRLIGSAAKGIGKGLSEASSFGDTSDVEALLGSLTSQGESLSSLFTTSDSGYVAYLEDGIKMESFGGSNMPCLDFSKSHSFSPMETGEGTLFYANWTTNQSYNKKIIEYVNTLGETSYIMSKRVAALDIDDQDFLDFQQGLGLFDTKFRKDAANLWQALSVDLADGLGAESALVIDVNGSFPKVPNVPDVLLKNGKVPRIAYVSEVSNREKLQGSWNKINTSAENMLKTVSEMSGSEIPMQVPMSSEKNDLKTWFVPIPFQNNDFVPSVSVSDKLFFVSTSKTFSEGLVDKVKQGGGESRKGAWVHIDFKVWNKYAQDWFKLVEDNAEDVITDESAREDFTANKKQLQQALKVMETLKKMTMHTRNENGQTRTSLHLQAN